MNPLATSLQGQEIWPQEINKSHPKSEQKRCLKKPQHHSSPLTTCSLWVMMDKDFSRWDEIKIYMHCFLSQLVGRSSSFNSISAASDGHPESRLSHGAVSWQGLRPPLAHLDGGAAARGERWLLATLQIAADCRGSSPPPALLLSTPPPLFFFFTRIRFSLLHSIALLCHFLQLLSFPWNMALRQLIRVLHCVISSNFY